MASANDSEGAACVKPPAIRIHCAGRGAVFTRSGAAGWPAAKPPRHPISRLSGVSASAPAAVIAIVMAMMTVMIAAMLMVVPIAPMAGAVVIAAAQ